MGSLLRHTLRQARTWSPFSVRCTGNYASWPEAMAAAGGYHDPHILERTIAAVRRVQSGEAAFERDAVAFTEPDYRFPLLWALYRAAARLHRLRVVDFGGALGSAYYQHRALLDCVADVAWAIVDQPAHVAAGRREFATDNLSFHESIADAAAAVDANVLLLSSVVQCLPEPYLFLADVTADFPVVILDRVPLMCDDSTRLTVQHVPATIYRASFPAWFLSRTRILDALRPHHHLVAEWHALDDVQPRGGRAEHKGFLLEHP